jgi:hypothetical protein
VSGRPSELARLVAAVALLGGCGSGRAKPDRGAGEVEPLADNCEAPLRLSVEVSRLLTMAAAHATRSAACVDGPGTRTTVDEILVCPARDDQDVIMAVSYRVGSYHEGDSRACGANDCGWLKPDFQSHRTQVRFERLSAPGHVRVRIPASLPGIAEMTPLDQQHEGDCYGQVGPFVPDDIALK